MIVLVAGGLIVLVDCGSLGAGCLLGSVVAVCICLVPGWCCCYLVRLRFGIVLGWWVWCFCSACLTVMCVGLWYFVTGVDI